MRGLLRFLYKYRSFELFILLELVGIWMLVQHNRYYNVSYLNSSNALVGNVNEKFFNTEQYFELREVNQTLAEENALLREQLSKYIYVNNYQTLKINDSITNRYELIPAQVENNSTDKKNNYVLLDKGVDQGITPGMGVIGPKGIIGQVKFVSANFSTVVSLLHSGLSVSSKLKKNNTIGSIQWDGEQADQVKLKFIARHVPIAIGDTILTSGFNSVFPEGIHVGYVQDVRININESFYDIDVKLATSFDNLNMTYIVKDKFINEIDSLTQLIEE